MLGLRNPLFCMWTIVSTTWIYNQLLILESLSIVLAISRTILFFLSATPFCWGILGAEYYILIPWSQNYSNSFEVNYPLLLYLSHLIFRLVSFSITFLESFNNPTTYDFPFGKDAHVILE